ncbi:MAG: multidrug efflux pump [Candidatus Azotimanducaceae bacterium]|jgi:multidrug efflux pump
MYAIIETVIKHPRTTLSVLAMLVFAGVFARATITVEADPDITIPVVLVTIPHIGISPEDADRLIIRPVEAEVRSLEGIEEVNSNAREGMATIALQFDISFDPDVAISEVRAAVDRSRAQLPSTSEEPIIKAITVSDYPVIAVSLASDTVSERVLYQKAVELKYALESIPAVTEARLSGHREELLEATIDPAKLEHYQISQQDLFATIRDNNSLIAAGAMDTGQGRFAIKVPGLIENRADIYSLPIKSSDETVITLDKVASIRRTFKDRQSFTAINGLPSITVEVLRRPGANVIDLNAEVRQLTAELTKDYPSEISVIFSQDQSPFAKQQVTELQGNIVTAMALVMILVVAALGWRSGLLVGLAVPTSFLFAITVIYALGLSFNFMVMFGMLLGLGMLIDGAIVVIEYADRKMSEGMTKELAYIAAAKRMFWPVLASTATTLAAFVPLFFWPGTSGQFMQYLPITVFAVLFGSLLYALFFGPTLGALFGKAGSNDAESIEQLNVLEHGDVLELKGITGMYARFLRRLLNYPVIILTLTICFLFLIFKVYGSFGAGYIYFTTTDPTNGRVSISARGNYSKSELQDIVTGSEAALMPLNGVHTYFTSTSRGQQVSFFGGGSPADQVGTIFMDMENVRAAGTTGYDVLELAREKLAPIAGIQYEIIEQEYGPPTGKDIQIQVSSKFRQDLEPTIKTIRTHLDQMDDLRDVEDTRVLPGIEWELAVDRAKAALFNVNVNEVGAAVQLVTNGLYLGEYRPDDAEEEVEIRLRYPLTERNIDSLDQLRVTTPSGSVPVSNFVERRAKNKLDSIERVDGEYIMTIRANVKPGIIADNKVLELEAFIQSSNFDPRINILFRGATEEQNESIEFIVFAFVMSLLLMFILLVAQFNSFYQATLILSAVVMSTAGVLLGLLTFDQTFSVMLTGIGIVALAGIVVNNNIILIDTYNEFRGAGVEIMDAIVKTGAQRLRPVFLTTATTILGLLPLATNVSIDIINRDIVYGGQVSSYWVKLASSIVYGLTFATVLTLVVTPLMLILPESFRKFRAEIREKLMARFGRAQPQS